MPQEILRQNAFIAGELDSLVDRRRDVKAYFTGLARAENLIPVPQGPIERRPGLKFCDRIRRPLVAVAIPEGAVLDAPNGGDETEVLAIGDGSLVSTTAMEVVTPYVLLTIDFGAPTAINAVDLIDYAAVAGGGGAPDPPPPGGWNPPGGGGGFDPYGGGGENVD